MGLFFFFFCDVEIFVLLKIVKAGKLNVPNVLDFKGANDHVSQFRGNFSGANVKLLVGGNFW